jgi:hypothetical protein
LTSQNRRINIDALLCNGILDRQFGKVQGLVEGTASAIISFSVKLPTVARESQSTYYAFMHSGGSYRRNGGPRPAPASLEKDWCRLPTTDMAGSIALSGMVLAVGFCGLQFAAMADDTPSASCAEYDNDGIAIFGKPLDAVSSIRL